MYGSCICSPGFAATEVGCVACTSGTYKEIAGGSPGFPLDCSACPDAFMVTDTHGASSAISGATRVQQCRCPYGSWRSASILSYSSGHSLLVSPERGIFKLTGSKSMLLCEDCPIPSACRGDRQSSDYAYLVGNASCANGHQGTLCIDCKAGFALADDRCQDCGHVRTQIHISFGALGSLMIVCVCIALIFRRNQRHTQSFARTISFIRRLLPMNIIKTCAAFTTLYSLIPVMFEMQFPAEPKRELEALAVFRWDFRVVTRCLFGMDYFDTALVKTALPLALILCYVCFGSLSVLLKRAVKMEWIVLLLQVSALMGCVSRQFRDFIGVALILSRRFYTPRSPHRF